MVIRIKHMLCLLLLVPGFSAADPGLGLPEQPVPAADSVVTLGKKLFFDRRLSINNTLSCAMCHIPEQGFAQNQLATPVGLEGKAIKRNSPTLLNVSHQRVLFHDGREFSLENQVWSPLLSPREMGNLSIGLVIEKIRGLDDYERAFAESLGDIDAITIGKALAAYQQTLIAADSDFDRWYFNREDAALTAEAKKGFTLFNRHGCSGCHLIGESEALFTDHEFHNTGIGFERSMSTRAGQKVIRLTDTVTITTDETFEGEVFNDLGRYEVTGDPADRWRYRTPTLRNITLTAPYMHDGSLATLNDVIDFYMQGGITNPGLDEQMLPFTLNNAEVTALIAFLESLTSPHIDELIRQARTVKVGDT